MQNSLRKILAADCEIMSKDINAQCKKNAEFVNV